MFTLNFNFTEPEAVEKIVNFLPVNFQNGFYGIKLGRFGRPNLHVFQRKFGMKHAFSLRKHLRR